MQHKYKTLGVVLVCVLSWLEPSLILAQDADSAESSRSAVDPEADRATEFVAVEGASEPGVSGGTLLLVAYACLWLLPFFYLARVHKAQINIARELEELKRQLGAK